MIKKDFCEAQNSGNSSNCNKVQEKLWKQTIDLDYEDLVGHLFIQCTSHRIDCGCKK